MLKPSLLLKQTKSVAGYDFTLLGIFNETFWIGGQLRNNFNSDTFVRLVERNEWFVRNQFGKFLIRVLLWVSILSD